MTKLEKLIEELCPNGVEYVNIGEVVDYEQPTKYIVENTDYKPNYPTPVLTAGQTFILGYTNEGFGIYDASSDNPVIIFDDFTGAFKWVDFPFKVKSSAMKILTIKNHQTNIRYIYHIMSNIGFISDEHKRLWISVYSAFKIPLPPLPIQEEIVRILDNFTKLTAELEEKLNAELEARKKQYEYYRDKLLTFDCADTHTHTQGLTQHSCEAIKCEWRSLQSISEISTGSHNTNEELEEGDFKFFVRSQEVRRLNSFDYDETAIITSGDGVGVGKIFHYVEGKYALHQRAYRIHITSSDISPKFFYYYMKTTFLSYIEKTAFNSSVTSIRRPMLNNYPVPIPPLTEQERIVNILDRFDKLCSDITEGLPAEIEARRKQYEYYRDKLLTFTPVSK